MFNVIQGLYCKAVDTVPEPVGDRRTREVDAMIDEGRVKRLLYVTYFFSALIVLMVGSLCYFIAVSSHDFCLDSRNARHDLLAKNVIRGDILTADGKVIATTKVKDGDEVRSYPYKNMFCHVGGRSDNGKTGVELLANDELLSSDINGLKKIENDINELKNPGNNVITTLNYSLQKAAYDALGDMKGAVVVLEPKTGKVLALVSKPDYDPNNVSEKWEKLNKDEDGSHRLMNRATTGLYQPGSTFKVLTLLEYMRENKDYEDFKFNCKGETRVNGVTVHCAAGLVHGKEDLKSSFANSCNSAFATIGCGLDMERMRMLAETFLFNRTLPGQLTDKAGAFALTGKSEDIDIPQSIIGLSTTLITPLHNALIAATIANEGVMMTPYVIDHVENANGGTVTSKKPEKYNRIILEEEAEKLNEYMCAVVEDGTGSKLSTFPFKVAGKTGTATYDKDQNAHAWFIGFAPADDPEIAISVVCESAGSGSRYAVPVAKKVLEAWERIREK
ncbi:MAG: penicillin-binding protein 2, partial [Lachnospiraceae bacterium]|nr:penicillin-binding protein 2 [Lachnospiraceae bacterium]